MFVYKFETKKLTTFQVTINSANCKAKIFKNFFCLKIVPLGSTYSQKSKAYKIINFFKYRKKT